MNKKQLACEAVLYEIHNPGEFELAKLRMLAAQNNGRGKMIQLDSSERFHTNEVLARQFGVAKGYIVKMKNLYRTDREAFDYIHTTGKDIPRLRVNGVYLISAGIPSPTKIGRTDCLELRLSGIQTGSWLRLKVVKWMPLENSEEFEMELHKTFSKMRLNGEWFDLTNDDLTVIETMYQNKMK